MEIDTNTISILLKALAENRSSGNTIWAVIVAGVVMALPAIMSWIRAESAKKSSDESKKISEGNTVIALDTNRIAKEQVEVMDKVHTAVNSGKTIMEAKIESLEKKREEQDNRIVDLEKKLSVALEKVEAMFVDKGKK
jgi:hypothetical protein